MIGLLLCRIGLHSWKLTNGIGYSRPDLSKMLILFDKDCRRCGKHAEGGMVI